MHRGDLFNSDSSTCSTSPRDVTAPSPASLGVTARSWILQGFFEDELVLDENSRLIEEKYPNCKVLPLSKLTVNETGVENGYIKSFSVQIMVRTGLWTMDMDVCILFFLYSGASGFSGSRFVALNRGNALNRRGDRGYADLSVCEYDEYPQLPPPLTATRIVPLYKSGGSILDGVDRLIIEARWDRISLLKQ